LIVRRLSVGRSKQSFVAKEQELIDGLKYPVLVAPAFRCAWRGVTNSMGGVSGDGRAAFYFLINSGSLAIFAAIRRAKLPREM
jgi:hypothetical protein